MSDRIKALRAELLKKVTLTKGLAAELEKKGKDASQDEHQQLATALTEAKQLKNQIADLSFLEETETELNEAAEAETKGVGRRARNAPDWQAQEKSVRSRWGSVKNFRRDTKAESSRAAYEFGMWYAAAFGKAEEGFTGKARQYCLDHGIKLISESGTEIKTMKESLNTTGGYLVPPEFDSDLIDLRELYGVFRRNARIVPMMRDTKDIGRRTSGLTAYFTGEAQAATEAEKGWDLVSLTAKKLMTLTRISSELDEDIMIAIGDDLAGEIGYAFANKEDECGFNGDTTSTYGGINGVRNRLKDVYSTTDGVGQRLGSGNLYSELTLADFNAVVGKLPDYADARAKWYVSRFFWASVMQRLATAAGGVTAEEVEGKRQRTFLGYAVEVSQVMPKTEANSQVCAVFGDLRLAARFGDRRQTTISLSEHRYFDTDEIGLKGSERFDINVHDVGDSTNAGPVVSLITAAS